MRVTKLNRCVPALVTNGLATGSQSQPLSSKLSVLGKWTCGRDNNGRFVRPERDDCRTTPTRGTHYTVKYRMVPVALDGSSIVVFSKKWEQG
jgi:hypothetical protein